ncbi:hypothetical protein Pcinc_023144 [Petrolisthes cinctipes]|uniref:U1-type domain-containing protein n=1 Tax=Petrolisthes cinctipes TaxID=88211 RepID=A0AAE1FG64_PETCI|nr:hypothetical protein Pcinc_023144 [Petrolisthes cinctipes]
MASVDEAVYMALSDGYEVVEAVEETREYVQDDGSGEAETLQYSIKTVKRECVSDDNDISPKKKKFKGNTKSVFKEKWLEDPDFKDWLRPDPTNKYGAICSVCNCKMIHCSPYSLRHHQTSVKHIKNLDTTIDEASGSESDKKVLQKKVYLQAFKSEWMENPEFNTWLERHPTDKHSAICSVCNCVMKQCNKSAITRHNSSSKHKSNMMNNKKKVNTVRYEITVGNESTPFIEDGNTRTVCKKDPSTVTDDNTITVSFGDHEIDYDDNDSNTSYEEIGTTGSGNKRISEKGGKLWYRQTFKGEWLEDPELNTWLAPDYNDKYSGYCTVCECKLKNCNKSTIKRHLRSRKHVNNLDLKKNARPVSPEGDDMAYRPSPSPEKPNKGSSKTVNKVARAEFILSRFMTDHGMPFSQAEHLATVLKKMFPDSKIARSMSVKRTNSHVMQESIAHEERDMITKICKENRFSLIVVEESLDIPVSQTLALMVRYFDKKRVMITDALLDVVEVDNASPERFYFVVKEMLIDKEIPFQNILGFASDNSSTLLGENDGFQVHLLNDFPNVFILGCVCHSLVLCARIASKELSPWLDSFFEEFCSYFATRTKMPSQFHELQEISQSIKRKPTTISHTEWFVRQSVISKILDKWDVLLLYFEENVANEITEKMYAPGLKHMLLFLNYVLGKVEKMNTEFQSKGFRLSTLFSNVSDEYRSILGMFINDDVIHSTKLAAIDPYDENLQKSLTDLSLGGRCEALLATEPLMEDDTVSLRSVCMNFLVVLCVQMKARFPFDGESVLSMLKILDPKEALSCNRSLKAIAKLAVHFPTIVAYGDMDTLQDQWTDLLYMKDSLKFKTDSPSSFWYDLQSVKDGNGQAKFGLLSELMCNLLALPHSSLCVESVFSQIHTIKTKETKSLYSSTVASHLLTRQAVARQETPNRKGDSPSDAKCVECSLHLRRSNQKVFVEEAVETGRGLGVASLDKKTPLIPRCGVLQHTFTSSCIVEAKRSSVPRHTDEESHAKPTLMMCNTSRATEDGSKQSIWSSVYEESEAGQLSTELVAVRTKQHKSGVTRWSSF